MASSSSVHSFLAVPSSKFQESYGKCYFIWDGLHLADPMPLPAKIQTEDSCSFASSTRQAELNFMIEFDRVGVKAKVEFDQFEWEKNVRRCFPSRKTWDPIDLLNLASMGMKNDRVAMPVKIAEGTYLPHWISTTTEIPGMVPDTHPPQIYTRASPDLIRHWLLNLRIPVIATIPIVEGYPFCSEHPYIGVDYEKKKILAYYDVDGTNMTHKTHSVVLVGIFVPSFENPLGLDTSDVYYIYQGSFVENHMRTVLNDNFLPAGMTIVSSHLVKQVCFSTNHPPSALMKSVPPSPRVLWDMKNHHAKLLEEQLNAEKIACMWRKKLLPLLFS